MDDKKAIRIAKDYVSDRLADEQVTNIGLEEVELSAGEDAWNITIGFSRPWNTPRSRAQEVMESLGAVASLKRSFKVIKVGQDGKVLSMKSKVRAEVVE